MTETRNLALMVLADQWSAATLAPQVEAAAVATAIADLSSQPRALMVTEPKLDGERSRELRRALQAIGAKTWPTMDNRSEWLDALLLALSNLPAGYVVEAAREAIHVPYRFHNEPEAEIRRLVAEKLERRRLAAYRLGLLRDEIARAMAPAVPQIEDRSMVWDEAKVAEANRCFAKIGLRTRYRYEGNGEVSGYSVEVLDEEEKQEDIGGGTQGD